MKRAGAVVAQQDPEPITGASAPKGTLNATRWNEVLEAAATVFHEKGYQAARIEDIATRVGILKGSLYYSIESKEDLLYALTVGGHTKGLATIEEDDDIRAADPATRLDAFITRWLAMVPTTGEYAQVTERDVRLLSDQRRATVMEMRNEMHRYVRRIIEQGIAEGHFDPATDPGVATNSIFELLNSTVRWFRPTGRLSYDDLAAFYRTFVLRGLSPAAKR
jgi:TetR/AcrR family transcriptional regulator, cholesterol catabolism regulator